MKKYLLAIVALAFSIHTFSQIDFENGYFIDGSDRKVTCLIKNMDWKSNPTEFEYKLSENEEVKLATIATTKAFGIDNVAKYVRAKVMIDRSSENIRFLSIIKNPVFTEETIFLKVQVEGKATLYQFNEGNLERFFYSIENSPVEQLVYKSYKISDTKVGKNNQFRQQLIASLNCSNQKPENFDRLTYKLSSLSNYFIENNQCYDSSFKNFNKESEREKFNINLRPSVRSSALNIQTFISGIGPFNFENETGFGVGVEFEYILNFNKNKWSIVVEPTYQYFKSEVITRTNTVSGGQLIAILDYQSIELPFSIRHYMYLNDNSKIFVNIGYTLDFNLKKSSLELVRADSSTYGEFLINSRNNAAIGIGYKFKDKYGLELRYQASRELLGDNNFAFKSKYQTTSLILSYTIF